MSKLTTVRNKLDKKLFDTGAVLRSSATLYTYSEGTGSFGGYNDSDATYSTGTSIACVPYNNIPNNLNVQSFGDMQEGDMFLVVRYNTTVNVRDKITFNGNNYKVQEIKEIPINDGIAGIILQLRIKN